VLSEASAVGKLGESIGLAALVILCGYVVIYSRKAKATAE